MLCWTDCARRSIRRARPIAQEFEKYVVDEYCPWLFLYDEEHIYGVNEELQWTPSPFERMDLQYATMAG